MVPYPRLAQFNYLQRPKTPLVCILRRNQGGGGVVKQPTLNMYSVTSFGRRLVDFSQLPELRLMTFVQSALVA